MANTMEKAILKIKFAGAVKEAALGAEQILYDSSTTVAEKIAAILTDIAALPTDEDVAAAVATAGHAKFKTADEIPAAANAEDNVFYLVMNSETSHYDIYAKVGGEVVRLDDTTVDLSEYAKKTDLHTHTNKTVLDGITSEKVNAWDGKADASHTHTAADVGAAEASHTHTQSDITGLADALDGKADQTALDALGRVYVSATEPTGLKDGDVWIQIVE